MTKNYKKMQLPQFHRFIDDPSSLRGYHGRTSLRSSSGSIPFCSLPTLELGCGQMEFKGDIVNNSE